MSRHRRPRSTRGPAIGFEAAVQLHAAGKLEEAEAAYRKLLAGDRKNARLHHLFGRLLHQRGRSEEGIERLQAALSLAPDDSAALNDLGLVLRETGALGESVKCFKRLVALQPDNVQGLCNLGDALKASADFSGAETAYRDALVRDPSQVEVYPSLAAVLRRLDRLDAAAEVFEQWLEHDPDNAVALHLRDAGREDAPDRASAEYVREVFDEFADTYDDHLAALANQGPQLIADALPDRSGLEVLDAGCGTGLCGEFLRPIARRLVGVDLSPKMLARAAKIGSYDELIEQDLVVFLESCTPNFDLIVSGDTLGYFGDLSTVAKALAGALATDGQLIATFETAADEAADFQLMKSGRYKHALPYIERVLTDAGFEIEATTARSLREEAGVPVACLVVCAKLV